MSGIYLPLVPPKNEPKTKDSERSRASAPGEVGGGMGGIDAAKLGEQIAEIEVEPLDELQLAVWGVGLILICL